VEGLYSPPEKFINKRVRDVLPADVAEQYEQAIERTLSTQSMQTFEYRLTYGETERRVFDARMVPKDSEEVVVIVRDITDVKALEEQLRQSQKMEAIGRLAGGVAHDFNNLLTVINGYADLLAARIEGEAELELLHEIRQSGERAAGLTRQLLMFSRRQFAEPQVLDLNEVIAGAQKLIKRLIAEDVILNTQLADDLPPIRADHGQLEQLLVNLSVNARDAMPEGGELRITSRRVVTRSSAAAPKRDYVELTVSDTGIGIANDIKDRIFEPFFTTKPPGHGTGLGLSVVFGVVKSCDGFIQVESAPGRGTMFRMFFPVAPETAGARTTLTPADTMPRGTETLLLVEDEERVRALASRVLRACGYHLLEAADGRQALQIARDYSAPIDLAIVDVVMPHIGGRELAERLARVRPDTAVLFVSGYTDDEVLKRGVSADVFLQKPFTPTALAVRVRNVLDRHTSQ
jgi:signal transduction histidine kinase/CheY-like chemotaxis protein